MAILLPFLGIVAARRRSHTLNLQSYNQTAFFKGEIILILLIYTFFLACRWNVGVDFMSYHEMYNYYQTAGNSNRDVELGHEFVQFFFGSLGFSSVALFGFYAFFHLYFILYRFKSEKYLYPFICFLIICGPTLFLWTNILRQTLSMCIFVFASKYILYRKAFKYYCCVILAILFHKSAILLVPLYFIPRYCLFRNRYINLSLLIVSMFIGLSPTFTSLGEHLNAILIFIGYENYAKYFDSIIESTAVTYNIGIRQLNLYLLPMLVAWYSPKLLTEYKNKGFDLTYTFAICGCIYYNIFVNVSFIMLRVHTYVDFFNTITIAYLMHYLYKNHNTCNLLVYILIILLSILFVVAACMSTIDLGVSDICNYKFRFMR